jgi:hypothetical protein
VNPLYFFKHFNAYLFQIGQCGGIAGSDIGQRLGQQYHDHEEATAINQTAEMPTRAMIASIAVPAVATTHPQTLIRALNSDPSRTATSTLTSLCFSVNIVASVTS